MMNAIHRFTAQYLLGVLGNLLIGLEDGGHIAAAMGMPPGELEVLGVLPFQLVADVGEWVRLAVTPFAGMVVTQVNLYPHHEVQVLHPLRICCAIGYVRLRRCKPLGVHVR